MDNSRYCSNSIRPILDKATSRRKAQPSQCSLATCERRPWQGYRTCWIRSKTFRWMGSSHVMTALAVQSLRKHVSMVSRKNSRPLGFSNAVGSSSSKSCAAASRHWCSGPCGSRKDGCMTVCECWLGWLHWHWPCNEAREVCGCLPPG